MLKKEEATGKLQAFYSACASGGGECEGHVIELSLNHHT